MLVQEVGSILFVFLKLYYKLMMLFDFGWFHDGSTVQERKLSEEEQKEKAQRCEFVQGLLLSTFLDDGL